MNKTFLIILAIIILLLAGIWLWTYKASAPSSQQITPTDATSVINKDLQNIDTGDLDQEFQDIDKNLQSL